jgi:hypothetical protein
LVNSGVRSDSSPGAAMATRILIVDEGCPIVCRCAT